MTKEFVLNQRQQDTLKEVCNIGAGHASTALAQMLSKKVIMTVPRVLFLSLEETLSLAGKPEDKVACINIPLAGEVSGVVIFIFSVPSTFKLVDLMLGLPEKTKQNLDEMGKSLIKETGNILAGSFVSAISNLTGLKIQTNVPQFAFDMLGATLSSALVLHNYVEDRVLIIETNLIASQAEMKGYFFFLATRESLNKLFQALL